MKIIYRIHAIERMFERGIGVKDIRGALETGENIENYSDAAAYPSRLVLTRPGKRPLHVVAADNAAADEIIVVTGYRPDRARWTDDFRRRRMKCLMCKQSEPRQGLTTVTLERSEFSLVMKNVPALVCPECGEAYADETTAARLLEIAAEMEADGLQVVVRNFQSVSR